MSYPPHRPQDSKSSFRNLITTGGAFGLLAYISWSLNGPQMSHEIANERGPASQTAIAKKENRASSPTSEKTGQLTAQIQKPNGLGALPKTEGTARNLALEFKSRVALESYSSLHKLVLLNDESRRQRAALLNDRELIRSLEPLLKTAPQADDFAGHQLQDSAINLLLEAAEGGQNSEANAVLKSIVQDEQIENASLPLSARTELAGIKAIVLYRWSSSSSTVSQEIPGWLPGQTSTRIWENVLSRQDRNEQESKIEIAARSK